MAVIVDTYRKQKRLHPDRLVLIETGKVAMFLCEDAEDVSRLLAEPISTQHVIGRPAVVFAQARLTEVLTRLTVFGRRLVGVRRTGGPNSRWVEFSLESPSDISKIEFAHKVAYGDALDEITNGRMETSWDWFAFPRLRTASDTDGEAGHTLRTLRESRLVLSRKAVATHVREMASVLLASGAKGKRHCLPNSTVMIHQPSSGVKGQQTDIQIVADETLRIRNLINDILAKVTGQPVRKIQEDTERDNYMTATEAIGYGLIDSVLDHR
jgi:hypothetical protein